MSTPAAPSSGAPSPEDGPDGRNDWATASIDRIVDVMEELVRFTVLLRPHGEQLVDHYSERKEAGRIIDPNGDISGIALSSS